MARVQRAVRDAARVHPGHLAPRIVEHAGGDGLGLDLRHPWALGRPLHEEGGVRSRLPGDDDLGNTGAGPRGQQERVGLVLDVLETGEVQRRGARVLVEHVAPEVRHELRVGLVASEDADPQRSGVISRQHEGAVEGLHRRELDVGRVDPELAECGGDLRARRSPTG